MNAIRTLSMLWAASLSYVLAGCAVAVPEEGEDDPDLEEGAGEESAGEEGTGEESANAASEDADDATSEVSSEIQSEPANAVGCGGNQKWCLARCNRTGDHRHVVGHESDIVGGCANAGEEYCRGQSLGYRTHACWGHL